MARDSVLHRVARLAERRQRRQRRPDVAGGRARAERGPVTCPVQARAGWLVGLGSAAQTWRRWRRARRRGRAPPSRISLFSPSSSHPPRPPPPARRRRLPPVRAESHQFTVRSGPYGYAKRRLRSNPARRGSPAKSAVRAPRPARRASARVAARSGVFAARVVDGVKDVGEAGGAGAVAWPRRRASASAPLTSHPSSTATTRTFTPLGRSSPATRHGCRRRGCSLAALDRLVEVDPCRSARGRG